MIGGPRIIPAAPAQQDVPVLGCDIRVDQLNPFEIPAGRRPALIRIQRDPAVDRCDARSAVEQNVSVGAETDCATAGRRDCLTGEQFQFSGPGVNADAVVGGHSQRVEVQPIGLINKDASARRS